jgi:hypothetical protein
VPAFGADPFVERLRDALGTLRSVYAAAPDKTTREVLRRAGDAVASALDIAQSRRREKELGGRLRTAARALDEAAKAAPWAAPTILGALERLPRMRR